MWLVMSCNCAWEHLLRFHHSGESLNSALVYVSDWNRLSPGPQKHVLTIMSSGVPKKMPPWLLAASTSMCAGFVAVPGFAPMSPCFHTHVLFSDSRCFVFPQTYLGTCLAGLCLVGCAFGARVVFGGCLESCARLRVLQTIVLVDGLFLWHTQVQISLCVVVCVNEQHNHFDAVSSAYQCLMLCLRLLLCGGVAIQMLFYRDMFCSTWFKLFRPPPTTSSYTWEGVDL